MKFSSVEEFFLPYQKLVHTDYIYVGDRCLRRNILMTDVHQYHKNVTNITGLYHIAYMLNAMGCW